MNKTSVLSYESDLQRLKELLEKLKPQSMTGNTVRFTRFERLGE